MPIDAKQQGSIAAVRAALMPNKSKTAGELSQDTLLSVVSVNAALKAMTEAGEVARGHSISSGGRPGAVYTYNSAYKLAAVIYGYVKSRKLTLTLNVVDLAGETVYKQSETYKKDVTPENIDALFDAAFEKFDNIAVAALGLPGVEKDGKVLTNDFRALEGMYLLQHVTERYSVPSVYVNDVNCVANGYYHRCAKGCGSAAAIWLPKVFTPGMGLILNGKIHMGYNNFAGEISYMPIGVDWFTLNYENLDAVENACARLVSAMYCITAPEKTVLYGDFWRDASQSNISHMVSRALGCEFFIETQSAANFENDFEQGLIIEALSAITFEE